MLCRSQQDVGTLSWPFTRELIQVGQACDWDLHNERLRRMAFSMGAGRTNFQIEYSMIQDSQNT